jgi:hypothetical protein
MVDVMSDAPKPLQFILGQIKSAKLELNRYPPSGCDWFSRSKETTNLLIPWLIKIAPDLKTYVEELMNSSRNARNKWALIVKRYGNLIPSQLVRQLTEQLQYELILFEYIGGNLISKIIEKYLIKNFKNGVLASNGNSDYPDLFLKSKDYTDLPKFGRKNVETFGAALKGKNRPVRVPDGLEIKTCRDRIAVDCHYAHTGLHLVLLFHETECEIIVDDILVAFMHNAYYRITKPKTGATTLKASFNGANFVSLLI